MLMVLAEGVSPLPATPHTHSPRCRPNVCCTSALDLPPRGRAVAGGKALFSTQRHTALSRTMCAPENVSFPAMRPTLRPESGSN